MSNMNPWGNGMQYGMQQRPMMPQYSVPQYGMPQNYNTGMQPTPRQLIRVSGMDGARAFQMGPNEVAALFDEGDDILYVKSTDGAGFPTIRRFRFHEEAEAAPVPAQPVPNTADYVTRAEFEELKGWMMQYGKQPVRKQAQRAADPDGAE